MQAATSTPFSAFAGRVVPLPVDLQILPADAMAMFRAWVMAYMDDTPTERMWVPVGRVGPMVVLGHPDPENAPTPSFPLWAFGLARISELTHQRLREQAVERLTGDEEQVFEFTSLPDTELPSFDSASATRAAVEYLLAFPGAIRDASSVRGALAGTASEDELLGALPPGWREAALALALNLPVVDLSNFAPSPDVMAMVPDSFAREHDLIPLSVDGGLIVAACPVAGQNGKATYVHSSWKAARQAVAQNHRLSLVLCAAGTRGEIERRVIKGGNKAPAAPKQAQIQARAQAATRAQAALILNRKDFERIQIDTPTIDDSRVLSLALYRAIEANASDLHIDIEGGAGRMRIRRDNFMRPLGSGRFAMNRLGPILQLLRQKINATGGDLNAADGKFTIRADDSFYDVRVSILPTPDSATTGYGYAVLRFLPKDGGVRALTDLHMAKEELALLMETLDKPNGIVLVTGPTGSGKTTTLNACVQQLNKGLRPGEEGALKILTAEDPVEYTIDGVQQLNVSKQIDFAEAIRRFLRQDPDVILVGEIRDRETADAAITAARTGHLVFSTLHTNGAAETISRLIGMGLDPYDLTSLLTIVAQRLVPRLCTNCKAQRPVSEAEASQFKCCNIPVPAALFEPSEAGCHQCDKGWKGRIPVLEIVKVTRRLKEAIVRKAPEPELQSICRELGFRPLHEQALLKVAMGDTSMGQSTQLHGGWD